ncbi:uncharacterized protein LOC110984760 [Acanthaster planci]|uniref:Uncharacterized protein LOC110984760 n=1 Tax=Acanthaster planci TaxID=133434 RepID=A0A8B7Z7J8_ACAPL|nr:uncharacterized protein LOC110984760 [Acanthaster planci]
MAWFVVLVSVVLVQCGSSVLGSYKPSIDYIQDPNPSLLCLAKNVSDVSGRVHSHLDVERAPYAPNMDCLLTIDTQPGRRINLRFDFFDLAPGFDRASNRCRSDADRFMVYESDKDFVIKNDILQPEVIYCGGTGKFPKDYQSYGNIVTIRFVTDGLSSPDTGVKLVYTSYKPPQEGSADCFRCVDNSMCIDEELTCNDVPNCNDDSDEAYALCREDPSNFWEIGIEKLGVGVVATICAAIGLLILIIFITCIVCCCYYKKGEDDQKQYRTPPTPRPGSYPSHNSNYSSYSSSASTTNGGMHPMPGLHGRMYEGLHGMNGGGSINGSITGMNGLGSLPDSHRHHHHHHHGPSQPCHPYPHQYSMNGLNRSPYPNYPPTYPSLPSGGSLQNGGYSVAYNHDNGRMEFPHKV